MEFPVLRLGVLVMAREVEAEAMTRVVAWRARHPTRRN